MRNRCVKNRLKILSRLWEKWEMSGPLRGDFFWLTLYSTKRERHMLKIRREKHNDLRNCSEKGQQAKRGNITTLSRRVSKTTGKQRMVREMWWISRNMNIKKQIRSHHRQWRTQRWCSSIWITRKSWLLYETDILVQMLLKIKTSDKTIKLSLRL